MLAKSSTAEQLREARKRIAALERELQALRNSNPHNSVPPQQQTRQSSHSPRATHRKTSTSRPFIMTRRAAAAAAAADNQSQLTCPQPSHHSKSATNKSTFPGVSPSPYSDVSQDPSEHSSSEGTTKSSKSSTLADQRQLSSPAPEKSVSSPAPQQNSVQAPVKPQLQLSPKITSTSNLPTSPVSCDPASKPESQQKPTDTSQRTSHSSKASQQRNSSSTSSPKPSVPRRRPPPLPVVKTACTKKEKVHLVAKCTEPKPGQTRYWTEEEHERFLEAIAEYGEKAYVAISNYVETRTPKQVRTHAQKFQMKMARLARQSIEAGQPIQMPAGMRPVIELPIGSKSTIVTIAPDQTVKLACKSTQRITEIDPSIVSALAASQTQLPPSRRKSLDEDKNEDKPRPDPIIHISSDMSEESSSSLSDPYMEFIDGTNEAKDDMELENTFAAKLNHSLNGASEHQSEDGDFIMSGNSPEEVSGNPNDDLEDLDNIEDEDLSLAPFSNPSENWLVADNPIHVSQ